MAEAKELFGIDIVKASPQIRAAMADFQCSITEAETSTTSFYGCSMTGVSAKLSGKETPTEKLLQSHSSSCYV